MLYILPPLRTQTSSTSWSNFCGNGNGPDAKGPSWNDKRPPRVQLRNIQIVKDASSCFQEDVDGNRNPKSLSECYFAGKGTALVLPDADAGGRQYAEEAGGASSSSSSSVATSSSPPNGPGRTVSEAIQQGGNSNIQKHLQSMFYLLRPEETLKMAVKLESVHPTRTRYLVVVSRMGGRGTEESCLLGIDCNEKTTVGLVLKVLANARITLDGDGGFSVSVGERHHIFKPVSVQAMWSALQTLHKVSAKAREQNYFQGGSTHGWVGYYENHIGSDRSCLNEWHAMDDLESRRPPSPDSVRTKPTEREETERVIRMTLKEIMMSVDLDEVTSKVIRSRLEEELDMDLGEYKSFIDQEMLVILGQMDAPTEIFDHVYLGSEWNASNYEELRRNGVGHILNVTREIDNFFPGAFDYLNVRVYDDEKTDLLKHWDDTFKYITKAKDKGSKVLVHCKMGVSRSASVVIAYAMKAYNWDFCTALMHVKEKRSCIKPNTSFLSQLETYQGILDAMKNKEKLQRSKSETNLQSPAATNRKAAAEKVLAGSEPTPVTQALSKALAGEATKASGRELKRLGVRPKSWSPDNATAGSLAEAVKSSPLSISLEDVSQKSSSKESVRSSLDSKSTTLARHVLMPCDNGESYSVSPNQIVHLPGHDMQQTQQTQFKFQQETWDPGERGDGKERLDDTSEACDSDSETAWTSSVAPPVSCSNNSVVVKTPAERRDGDPFSNHLDRVFDWEEKRQHRVSIAPTELPSRQNSWSSYDSAVVLGGFAPEDASSELSRHSSWGSGDARAPPSRNSSWGSYDMRRRDAEPYGIFPYDKEDIPWHPGTVRRSKQKIEGKPPDDSLTGSCASLVKTPSSETLLIESDVVVEAINPAFLTTTTTTTTSAISDKIDIPGEDRKDAAPSSRLSISAPEPSSMELVPHETSPLSRSASVISTGSSVKQHRTFLENLQHSQDSHAAKRTDEVLDSKGSNGKVRNLKKEFEAKANDEPECCAKKGRANGSLPSSPVSAHLTKEKKEAPDDVSFKNLIGIFENKDEAQVNRRQKLPEYVKSPRNTRYSCIEISVEKAPQIVQSSLISHKKSSTLDKNESDYRRPPIPSVKAPSPGLMVAATVITAAAKKKQQQYGKSHPLAKLNIKPRHNNPVYNTM